jgi:hypothetical protein
VVRATAEQSIGLLEKAGVSLSLDETGEDLIARPTELVTLRQLRCKLQKIPEFSLLLRVFWHNIEVAQREARRTQRFTKRAI